MRFQNVANLMWLGDTDFILIYDSLIILSRNLRLTWVFSIEHDIVYNGPDLFILCHNLVLCVFAWTFLFCIFPYNFDWFGFEPVPDELKIDPNQHYEYNCLVRLKLQAVQKQFRFRSMYTSVQCEANKLINSIQTCVVEVTYNTCNITF